SRPSRFARLAISLAQRNPSRPPRNRLPIVRLAARQPNASPHPSAILEDGSKRVQGPGVHALDPELIGRIRPGTLLCSVSVAEDAGLRAGARAEVDELTLSPLGRLEYDPRLHPPVRTVGAKPVGVCAWMQRAADERYSLPTSLPGLRRLGA